MSCLPQSGQCERGKTDPFAENLNGREKRAYTHIQCLDVAIRDRPQPEALYEDSSDGSTLVIERKSLMWPLDYAQKHQADHYFIDLILERIGNVTKDLPYSISFPSGISIDRRELESYADKMAGEIRPLIGHLSCGQGVKSNIGKHIYKFWLQHPWERDECDPVSGLGVEMLEGTTTGALDPANLPPELVEHIQKCFTSCASKFREYNSSRKVLLVDLYGELRYLDEGWWHDVFANLQVPCEISEIWSGLHDFISESERGWIFENLYSASGQR